MGDSRTVKFLKQKAKAEPVAAARVVIDVVQEGRVATLQVSGGRDGQHRQLILFRALETEMRKTMVFAQRVQDLMARDEDVRSEVSAYLQAREAEDREAAAQAASPIIRPSNGDVAAAEATKSRE